MSSDKKGPNPKVPLTGISGRESVFDKRLREFRNSGQFEMPKVNAMQFIKKQSQEFNTPSMDSKLHAPVQDADGYTETERLAFIDQSSGILNMRTMMSKLAKEVRRHNRYKQPFSIMIIELDGFSQSSQQNLSQIGAEMVFSTFCKTISKNIRDVDIIGRFDEPSVILICPQTNLGDAIAEAGRLRQLIASSSYKSLGGQVNMTLSIGIASCPENGAEPSAILGAALEAAQQAVAAGGNTVFSAAVDASVQLDKPIPAIEPAEDFSPSFDAPVQKTFDLPTEKTIDMSPSLDSNEIVYPAADVSISSIVTP